MAKGRGIEPWSKLSSRPDEEPYVPSYASQDLVSPLDPAKGTEYGGVDGLIQPYPHVPTARERLAMVHSIEAADDGVGPEGNPTSVVAPELEGDFT